jgi:hypothetical protein
VTCSKIFLHIVNTHKISGNLFVTISASARGICTRKCEQILCPGTFILFISTNGCLYNFFLHIMIFNKKFWLQFICNKLISTTAHESVEIISTEWFMHISHLISVNIFLENFVWSFSVMRFLRPLLKHLMSVRPSVCKISAIRNALGAFPP